MRYLFSILGLAAVALSGITFGFVSPAAAAPVFHPTVSDWQFISAGVTPPTQAQCIAGNRRCFNPASMAESYNYATLHTLGTDGTGVTIAVVDSYGSDTIAHDLNVFNTAFGLPHMCGEEGVTCVPGMPTFSTFSAQASPATNSQPPNNGTGLEDKAAWALEVSLDVEWAHATAPGANILLVTTPTAETLGVQGFPQMMNAVQQVVDNHLADIVSMSLAAGEGTFYSGTAALTQLRQAFVDAKANNVTVFGSSGDSGTANSLLQPVPNYPNNTIPYPSVEWPASDPLVTGVGGTYLCTDAVTGTFVDSIHPPVQCVAHPGVREVGWIAGGGGYSILFPRPVYQNTLPPGSTYVGSSVGAPGPNSNMRGVPDIAYQASSRTGVLVYITLPPRGLGGFGCPPNGCSTGWYVVGGTSAGSPQWAGITAMADQVAGRDLGFLNDGLYAVANGPNYAIDFYDVTVGCNQFDPAIPGYCASPGWDAVTGLGTPNVANLIPDLIAAIP